jgi:ribosome-associated toxin RatA of RatAB toxin-antitoxin module
MANQCGIITAEQARQLSESALLVMQKTGFRENHDGMVTHILNPDKSVRHALTPLHNGDFELLRNVWDFEGTEGKIKKFYIKKAIAVNFINSAIHGTQDILRG